MTFQTYKSIILLVIKINWIGVRYKTFLQKRVDGMKNLYMFQVNYRYGNSAHLPYTVASLVAYAMNDERIKNSYHLKEFFCLRDNPDKLVEKMEKPDAVGFSTYIWNYEFNKTVAKKIKDKYPECVIIFGGHHVYPGGGLLYECPYIDFLIHGEGEEPFRQLLLYCAGEELSLGNIPGVSYRSGDEIITNEAFTEKKEYIDYPSPYLCGYFDRLLEENPDIDFIALTETMRGCPNSCAYCDWSNMKSSIRKVPMERVLAEIEWISEHKIFGFGSADSNFGIFERDEQITDYIIELYLKNGYPRRFQTSFAKNSNERIFRIGKKLDKYKINRGVTLSFQSMSDEVLANIGRKNIPVSSYVELMKMYNVADVPTYTELILGLPGETYDSFASGIDRLFEYGQHGSLYIHNCEWLPCSVMGSKEYTEKFGIKTSRIPLNQPHVEDCLDEITEWSNIVVGTYSMDGEEWVKMNLFSIAVQCFHHMGLMKFLALYLHFESGVDYRSFYEDFISWLSKNEDCAVYPHFKNIENRLRCIASCDGKTELVVEDERFGKVRWPFEEYLYLCVSYELEDFCKDIEDFLDKYFSDKELFSQLLKFQKEMMKLPFVDRKSISFDYGFDEYFRNILSGKSVELERRKCEMHIETECISSWEEYAKKVVWYGRKDGKNVYLK